MAPIIKHTKTIAAIIRNDVVLIEDSFSVVSLNVSFEMALTAVVLQIVTLIN